MDRVLITLVEKKTERLVGQWAITTSGIPTVVEVKIPATANTAEATERPYTMVVQRLGILPGERGWGIPRPGSQP